MQKTEIEVEAEEIEGILSSKAAPVTRLDEGVHAAIARYQKHVADYAWEETLRGLNTDLKRHATVLRAATDDESVRRILDLRRPRASELVELRPVPNDDAFEPASFVPRCDLLSTSPPYTFGDPSVEEVGAAPKVVPGGGPADGSKTFSQLALPDEGAFSLGVGLGKLHQGPHSYTLYPPSQEAETDWPVAGGHLEATAAGARVGYFVGSLPGGPVLRDTVMELGVGVIVGVPSKPFYVVVPPLGAITYAAGVVHVFASSPGGAFAQQDAIFLEHREGPLGIIGPPTLTQKLKVSLSLPLRPGTNWVFVGIDIRLWVSRWFITPPPPPSQREGFVGIDVRSPDHGTHSIHDILEPGGPVTVPRLMMQFCPKPIFASSP